MLSTSTSALRNFAFLILIFVVLFFGKDVFMPLAIGGILATLFLPLCRRIERANIHRAVAAISCLLLLIVGVAGVLVLLGWEISRLSGDFVIIKQRALDAGNRMQEYIFNHLGVSIEKQTQILKDEQPSLAFVMQRIGLSFTYIFSNTIFTLMYVALLLYYRTHLYNFILLLAGPTHREKTARVIYSATLVSHQYLVGLSKMIFCLWVMYGIGFSALGVRNALFFAFLCGLLEIVPYIGNLTGTTLTLLVAAAQGAGIPVLGGIVLVYGFIQFIQGWILEPLIVGHQVKINPLFIILALVLGELVWGIAGVFLAIPLIAMLKTVCDNIESLKPYGFLLGETGSKKEELSLLKKARKIFHEKKG
ncbi:MAG: AI-2E family transporter [bacterium]|nr:AI-2E family transporter [bacterium]